MDFWCNPLHHNYALPGCIGKKKKIKYLNTRMEMVLASQDHSKLIVPIPSVCTSKNNTKELETIQIGASGAIYGMENQP